MKLINIFVVILLLAGAASAQLVADRDRFEIELHPEEMTKRSLTLENLGDAPLSGVWATPIGGKAKDLVELEDVEIGEIDPGDEEELMITFMVPPDTEPGTYEGFVYFMDGILPSLPLLVEFEIEVTEQENYGVSLSIEDAKSASMSTDADEPAEFELVVRNAGLFRDVISIDTQPLHHGWKATLFDGDEPVDLPYRLPLSAGASHNLELDIEGKIAGASRDIEVMATSLSDPAKNATVTASVELNPEIRKYEVTLDVPKLMVVNRTHAGTIKIELNVDEMITVNAVAPQGLMIMPFTQVVKVGEGEEGEAEFDLVATQPGDYTIEFQLTDSQGVPLPDEEAKTRAIVTTEFGIVTGEDVFHRAMVLAYAEARQNQTVPIVTIPDGVPDEDELETLMDFPISSVIILGNESIVPADVETLLNETVTVERIAGKDICETAWLFASKMWPEGTGEVMLVSVDEVEVFKAYMEARDRHIPLVICGSDLSEGSISTAEELVGRGLSKAWIWGEVDETVIQTLEGMDISTEEVA